MKKNFKMPYYASRKRKSFRPRRKYGGSTRKTATKAYVKKTIKKMSETKEVRYDYNDVGTVSGGLTSVSYGSATKCGGLYGAIAQGTGHTQRIGNSLLATGIRFDLVMSPGDTTNQLRLIFFTPKKGGIRYQPSDVTNFTENLLSGEASSTVQFLSPVDTSRFRVLYDKTKLLRFVPTFGAGTATDVYALQRHYKGFIKLNKKIVFDDEAQMTNDIYFLAISDSSVPAHPGAVAGYCVCYFKDL